MVGTGVTHEQLPGPDTHSGYFQTRCDGEQGRNQDDHRIAKPAESFFHRQYAGEVQRQRCTDGDHRDLHS